MARLGRVVGERFTYTYSILSKMIKPHQTLSECFKWISFGSPFALKSSQKSVMQFHPSGTYGYRGINMNMSQDAKPLSSGKSRCLL